MERAVRPWRIKASMLGALYLPPTLEIIFNSFMAISGYPRLYITAAFIAGILVTLGFKDVYPDLERHYRRRRHDGVSKTDSVDLSSWVFPGRLKLEDHERRKTIADAKSVQQPIPEGVEGCIGKTPLFKIKSLSEATGCEILAKAEVCNCSRYITRVRSDL